MGSSRVSSVAERYAEFALANATQTSYERHDLPRHLDMIPLESWHAAMSKNLSPLLLIAGGHVIIQGCERLPTASDGNSFRDGATCLDMSLYVC